MAHDTVLTVFFIIAAIAIVLQATAMLGIALAARRMEKEVLSIRGEMKQRLDPLITSVTEILAESREPVRAALANVLETTQTVRNRAHDLDRIIDEITDKWRGQALRIDQAFTDFVTRIQSTGTVLQRNVTAPIHEVAAVLKGLRVGMDFLFRRHDGEVRETPQDEQMFI